MKSVDLPHLFRQHRDFIKIMIKYKDFKQYWIQPDQSFFPNPISHNQYPERGKPEVSTAPLPTPKHPIGQERKTASVSLPYPLTYSKINWKGWMKNWLKNQDYHFIIDTIEKSKIPLIL